MLTVQHLALRYVTERSDRREMTRSTTKTTRWALLSFVAVAPDNPRHLTRRHVERWLSSQPHVGRNTLYTRFSTVRTFCRWMAVRGYTRGDVTLGVDGPRRTRGLPRSLTADEVGAVLAACPDARAKLIVRLMVDEGLRRVEVARLQLGDINHADRLMLVRGKGDAERFLPLMDSTYRVLAAYLDEHPATSGPLVRSYQYPTRGLTPDHIGRLVVEWMSEAGVKRAPRDGKSGHSFRHTCASDVLDRGAHIRQVQMMLGHASIATTEVYLRRVDATALRGVMEGRSYRPLSIVRAQPTLGPTDERAAT